jgi:hypothetical protein
MLEVLNLAHNGLDDLDGAVLLESLIQHPSWRVVDLSHNCLGGGSALVACQVVRQVAAPVSPHTPAASKRLSSTMYGAGDADASRGHSSDGGFGKLPSATSAGNGQLNLSICIPGEGEGLPVATLGEGKSCPPMVDAHAAAGFSAGGSVGSYWQQLDKCRRSTSEASVAATARGLVRGGHRLVLLDGNPLGASAVQALMLTIAGIPAVAAMQAMGAGGDRMDCCVQSSSSGDGSAPGDKEAKVAGAGAQPDAAECVVLHGIGSTSSHLGDVPKAGEAVGVSIQGCSLMSKEKGFRCSLSDSKPALAMRPAVPLMGDAVIPAAKGKGPLSKSSKAANNTAGKGSAGADGGHGSSSGGGVGTLVYTEKALGWDIGSPAGRYSLNLNHPAAGCMVEQLLLLKQRLGQLQVLQKQWQESVKAKQQQSSKAVAGVTAGRSQSGAGGIGNVAARGRATRDNVTFNGSKSGSRSTTPSPAATRRQTRSPSPVDVNTGGGERGGLHQENLGSNSGSNRGECAGKLGEVLGRASRT